MNPLKKVSLPDNFKLSELKRNNLLILGVFLVLVIIILPTVFYFRNTEAAPGFGGTYTEGIVGNPRFLNPVYSQRSEVDSDLTEILFAGLMKYDEDNELVPYLAEEVDSEEGRVYTVTLREDLKWSDGRPITADDIVFTVETIQNRNIQSPSRVSWEGVRAEKVDDLKVEFFLENASPLFIEKLTLKPIPEHLWTEVDEDDFQFSEYNLKPITSGPYMPVEVVREEERVTEITMNPNPNYFGEGPYIEELIFQFFRGEEQLLDNRRRLDGFALLSLENDPGGSFKEYSFILPRYFALFFNTDTLSSEIREALAYGTDKEKILSSLNRVERVDSPVIPSFYGLEDPEVTYQVDREKAIEVLESLGYEIGESGYAERVIREESYFEFTERIREGDQGEDVRELQRCLIDLTENDHEYLFPEGEVTGFFDEETVEAVNRFQDLFREDILDPHGFDSPTGMVAESTISKLNELCGGPIPEEREVLSVKVTTIDHPLFSTVIENLSEQWKEVGIELKEHSVDLRFIENEVIGGRNFESFLFGVSMESIPDPFRWWHSSQKPEPGLNFTGYENEDVDELLTTSISSLEKEERVEALSDLQNIILEEKPALFLYSPHYIYKVDSKVKGIRDGKIINSSQRFRDINNWYINTQRVWK